MVSDLLHVHRFVPFRFVPFEKTVDNRNNNKGERERNAVCVCLVRLY